MLLMTRTSSAGLLSRVALCLICIAQAFAASGVPQVTTTGLLTTTQIVEPSVNNPYNASRGIGYNTNIPDNDPIVSKSATGLDPEQIIVSQGLTPATAYITWITGYAQVGKGALAGPDLTLVQSYTFYSTSSNATLNTTLGAAYQSNTTGSAFTYSQNYNATTPGALNYTSGVIHRCKLTGLKYNTTYFYQVGDPSIPAVSAQLNFTTMPYGGNAFPVRFTVVGDLGVTYNSSQTVNHMVASNADMSFLVGDFTYANDVFFNGTSNRAAPALNVGQTTYQPLWDNWGRMMQPLTSKNPFMTLVGNHEEEPQGNGTLYTAYLARFPVKEQAAQSNSTSGLWYSFNTAGIHVIMFGAYGLTITGADYAPGSPEYNWLVADLSAVDRTATPWVVFMAHPPIYNTHVSHWKEVEYLRIVIEPVLYKYGVDIAVYGHVHSYERTNRVYNYTNDPCGTIHIDVGDGGNMEQLSYTTVDMPGNCPAPPVASPYVAVTYQPTDVFPNGTASYCPLSQPSWSAYREPSFGHATFDFLNATHCIFGWHRDIDNEAVLEDEVLIVRPVGSCFNQPQSAAVSTASASG